MATGKPRKKTSGATKQAAVPPVSERVRLVHELMGKYAYLPFTSEDHAREKQREIEREDRRK